MSVRTIEASDLAGSLALAIIHSSTAPLLLLDDELRIQAASASFCAGFGLSDVAGRLLAELGAGEWNIRQLGVLLRATADGQAAVEAYETDLRRAGLPVRKLLMNARKLVYHDDANIRLLLAISDVTEAHDAAVLREDLLREKAVMLRELQHRVANSLQIIASVLMQSARRVQSDDARSHLQAAHHRVMSVAAVQAQLSSRAQDDVRLVPYFSTLCASLAASLIFDPDKIGITVEVEECEASADISVSLGLIVTELVINALKHAFPDDRAGHIVVSYKTSADGWVLCVRDDGIGMPAEGDPPARLGLGSGIIQALAHQLDAEVQITNAAPGTVVTVSHTRAN